MLSIVRKFKNHSTKLTMASLSLFLVACKGGGDSQSLLTVSAGNNGDTISIQADNSRHFSLEADTINEAIGANEANANSSRASPLKDPALRADPVASLLYTRGYIYASDADVMPLLDGKETVTEIFFGGFKDLVKKNAEENDIAEGRLNFLFFINIDGSVSDAAISRNDFPEITEDEILRRINDTNNRWTPGIYRGEPVKVCHPVGILMR